MSFWPFNNALNSNNALSKFLESINEVSLVTVEDMMKDPTLMQEIFNELSSIKGHFNKNGGPVHFSPTSGAPEHMNSNSNSNANANPNANSDSVSFTSSNDNVGGATNFKDSRGVRLVELMIQPHILSGLIGILEQSVDFFFEQRLKEEDKVRKTIEEYNPVTDIQECEEIADIKSEEEASEEKFRRCVQIAADILSIDMWVISNRIIETPGIMNKLWMILKLPHLQENSPTVSYMVRILDQLLDANSIELLNYVRRQEDLVDTFLAKIEVPAIMDFFFRIIQTDKPDSPTGILETIGSQNVIKKLIDILKPLPDQFDQTPYIPDHQQYFKQSSATDFLKALVTISSNAALAVVMETNIGPNQLTRELVSPEIVNTIINDIMLKKVKGKDGRIQTNKHGINNCVSIVIDLIRKNNSDYDLNCGSYSSMLQNGDGSTGEINSYVSFQWLKDFEQNPPSSRDPIYLGDMLQIFSDNLDNFLELLEIEPIAPPEVTSEILGFTRFKISELVAELLHCSNMILLNSRKITKIISIRDQIRSQQSKRLRKALNDKMAFRDSPNVHDVTSGLDDVSLDDVHFDSTSPHQSAEDDETTHEFYHLINALDTIEDSEDEEPSISPENPFVCAERDATIRSDPCVGDLFKIKLIDSNILLNIINNFANYKWNNFFHNVVFDLIQQIFNGKLNSYNSFLIVELFKRDKCDLTGLIVGAFKSELEPRPGYMGHLILIGEEIVKFISLYKPDLISPIIVESVSSEQWNWFVNDLLSKTREVYNAILGADDCDDGVDYGYDSSSVGYLDMDSPKKIILGDTSNHDEFVHDRSSSGGSNDGGSDEDGEEEEEEEEEEDEDEDVDKDEKEKEGKNNNSNSKNEDIGGSDTDTRKMVLDSDVTKHRMLEDNGDEDKEIDHDENSTTKNNLS
ncbi:hypothetical protein KGF56_001799 [Candida oxycetoniae]|uniref:Uncharacterized protein n=1 Tax=Candida oxycetoniae TaxID=497107 RepID=A0AAI9SYF2_9ASCO|nr:uncharacterized protein KGF56_001799 [Candida oxycetoniae]KAI3405403.2 hypothetical protein KGF56_001799 [Candida oxycetoniae]